MKIHYYKIKKVKSPSKAYIIDAGIDFYVPNNFKKTILTSGQSIIIPSGIIMPLPIGYAGIFLNKSGIATKYNLLKGAQVIDSKYTGEIHLHFINVGIKKQIIYPNMKIAQMIIIKLPKIKLKETINNINIKSDRGKNGFGSSGE
jgi:dUTP pyrophosphatase